MLLGGFRLESRKPSPKFNKIFILLNFMKNVINYTYCVSPFDRKGDLL